MNRTLKSQNNRNWKFYLKGYNRSKYKNQIKLKTIKRRKYVPYSNHIFLKRSRTLPWLKSPYFRNELINPHASRSHMMKTISRRTKIPNFLRISLIQYNQNKTRSGLLIRKKIPHKSLISNCYSSNKTI